LNEYKVVTDLSLIRRIARALAGLEIWPVALLVAAGLVWPRLLPAAGVTAAFFWFVRWIAYGRLSARTPGDLAIALLVLTVPVTLWVTAMPEVTLPQVYRLLVGIAFYYALANWCNSTQRLRLLVNGTILAAALLALSAPISVQWAIGKLPFIPTYLYERFTLLLSDTIHPNVMAGCLVILCPIALAWLLFGWRKLSWAERLLSILAVLIMLAVIGLTQSRGAWIALGLVIVFLPVLRWRWGWIGLLLASGLSLGGIYYFGAMRVLDLLASSSTISGIDGRLEIWSRAIYMLQDFPFTGIGMGSFSEVADKLYPFFLASPGSIPHAHNLFLQIAVDLGIPGLIAWLATLFVVTAAGWQLLRLGRAKGATTIAGIGAGLLCSQLALVAHGLTDSVTWGMVRPTPIVWAVWGLAVAAYNVNLSGHSEAPVA
jgi:putative inorganic carbon (HCO3(-)) transporter